jgi:hypothetical protein
MMYMAPFFSNSINMSARMVRAQLGSGLEQKLVGNWHTHFTKKDKKDSTPTSCRTFCNGASQCNIEFGMTAGSWVDGRWCTKIIDEHANPVMHEISLPHIKIQSSVTNCKVTFKRLSCTTPHHTLGIQLQPDCNPRAEKDQL